jgi:hypothetical protein
MPQSECDVLNHPTEVWSIDLRKDAISSFV